MSAMLRMSESDLQRIMARRNRGHVPVAPAKKTVAGGVPEQGRGKARQSLTGSARPCGNGALQQACEPKQVTLSLPYPVSANRYWRTNSKTGAVYLSSEAKAYKRQVRTIAIASGVLNPMTRPVNVDVVFHARMNKDGSESGVVLDIDNVNKVLLDSMNNLVYVDDKQVRRYLIEFGSPIVDGGLTVTVSQRMEL